MKETKQYLLPARSIAYILYHMVYDKIYDPDVFWKFEAKYPDIINKEIVSWHAFGGLWAYYKSSMGSVEGIKFWETLLENNMDKLHA